MTDDDNLCFALQDRQHRLGSSYFMHKLDEFGVLLFVTPWLHFLPLIFFKGTSNFRFLFFIGGGLIVIVFI